MTRSILLILIAALTLFSALAHAKTDRLRMYAFASNDCNGPPTGGNIDVKLGKCMHIPGGAWSIKPLAHKYQEWVEKVNLGQLHCEINTFSQFGCFNNYQDDSRHLPESISRCISAAKRPIYSVSFNCSNSFEAPDDVTTISTWWAEVGMGTTWVSRYNTFATLTGPTTYTRTGRIISTVHTRPSTTHAVSVVSTPPPVVIVTSTVTRVSVLAPPANPSMKTIMLHDGLSPATVPSYLDDGTTGQDTDDETEQDTQQLVARNKAEWTGPRKGVWMLHPWSMGLICYVCYTWSNTNRYHFECRSGPAHPIECGEMPASTKVTENAIVPPAVTLELGESQDTLSKRKSWHRHVTFEHPWYIGIIMCADAEWDKRGRPQYEIRIQNPDWDRGKCNPRKYDQMQDIGVYTTTVVVAPPPRTFYTPRHTNM